MSVSDLSRHNKRSEDTQRSKFKVLQSMHKDSMQRMLQYNIWRYIIYGRHGLFSQLSWMWVQKKPYLPFKFNFVFDKGKEKFLKCKRCFIKVLDSKNLVEFRTSSNKLLIIAFTAKVVIKAWWGKTKIRKAFGHSLYLIFDHLWQSLLSYFSHWLVDPLLTISGD